MLPSACSEDAAMESMVSANQADDALTLEEPVDDLALKLDLTNPVLKLRVHQVRDSIEQFMTPEILALQQQGRQILRQRGVDPDTAFSGGPNDMRLALIPAAANVLDRLNEPFARRGYYIKDLYYFGNESYSTPTGRDTPGPWEYYWEKEERYGWIELTEDEFEDCAVQVLERAGLLIGSAFAAVNYYQVGGKALLAFASGEAILTVGAGLAILSAGWLIHRMDKCVQEKIAVRKCDITIDLEEYCKRLWAAGEREAACDNLMMVKAKMATLELRLGADTLNLVVDPAFNPGPTGDTDLKDIKDIVKIKG